jgi:hypothetical protein
MNRPPCREYPTLHTRIQPAWLSLAGLGLVLFLSSSACKLQGNTGSSQGQGAVLQQFLRYVPDTPENRKGTFFGDAAAWHASWNVPRIASIDALNELDDTPRADWLYILPSQTSPPECLDTQYLLSYSLKDDFGFDFFDMDRYLYTGIPPAIPTIAEFRTSRQQIADALTAKGYSTQEMASGWTLYSLSEDYAINTQAKMHAEQLGYLNRILLSDHVMIIGKATEVVSSALDAFNHKVASLADDPAYQASIQALQDPSLKDAGELVGAIWMDGGEFYAIPLTSQQLNDEQMKALMERYGLNTDLPAFTVAAFATRHSLPKKTTALILALVFPKGTDAKAAAQVLSDRLDKADSLRLKRPFLDVMDAEYEKVYAIEAGGLPVTLVVFHLADPEPKPINPGGRAAVGIRSWLTFIYSRDLMFLYLR